MGLSHVNPPRIAMFLPSMACGGAERMTLNLLHGFVERGIPVDLLLAQRKGTLLDNVPSAARVVDLKSPKVRGAIGKIAHYLRMERPHAILSRMNHANLAAILGKMLSRTPTRLVVTEAANVSALIAQGLLSRRQLFLMRLLYPRADAVICLGQAMAADMTRLFGLKPPQLRSIYNPVVDDRLYRMAEEPASHRWLPPGSIPVIVTAGRLTRQKDHATLLAAFAQVRRQRPARLIIFGEGEERARLESLRGELGLEADVDLPGEERNPYAAFRQASLFVLSSLFEGLPNVLIEALACGCPAVATDCPDGPAEIILNERQGLLAPPANPSALAGSMLAALDRAWDKRQISLRGADFSRERAVDAYLAALSYPESLQPLGVARKIQPSRFVA